MKIITEPSVYLVGKSAVNDAELDRFLTDNDLSSWQTDTDVGGEKLVEVAGRSCYWSFAKPRPGGNAAYTKHILEVGHGSVLEHSVYNLMITGVSRSFTHELVRQRAGMGYSQLSQRFVDESDCAFVVPPILGIKPSQEIQPNTWSADQFETHEDYRAFCVWHESVEASQKAYAVLAGLFERKLAGMPDPTARRKMAREAARSVLPNATETRIFVTGNARALRHFIEMRGDAAADAEIRKVAILTLQALQADSPNLFGDYQVIGSSKGPWTSTPYRKV